MHTGMSGKATWSGGLALALALSVAAVGCVSPPTTSSTAGSSSELGNASLSASNPSDGTFSTPRPPSSATIEKGTVDQARSNELTDYLRSHQLPLVGAQIVDASDGHPQVILYGFVATDRGQLDAETKTRKFMNVASLPISNRIKVNPELAQAAAHNANPAAGLPSTPDDFNSLGSAQSYQNQQAYDPMQQYQTQQYQSQSSTSGLSMMIPFLGMLLGGSSIGGGYGSYGGGYGGYGGGYGGYGGYGGGYGYPPPMMGPPPGYGAPPPGFLP